MAKRNLLSKKNISLITTVLALVIAFGQTQGWWQFAQPAADTVTQSASENQPGLYAIDHFIDGDTISVKMNGKAESVRMIGVDTPETHKPNTPVQCYGPAASAYTKNLIGDNKVRLEADPTNQNRDRYNRLLRYVYLPNNKLVNRELVANGYGFAYTSFPFQKKAEFVTLEKQAKDAAKGLWGNCTVTVEASGREQTNNQ
jgi:micrococcal nuclease